VASNGAAIAFGDATSPEGPPPRLKPGQRVTGVVAASASLSVPADDKVCGSQVLRSPYVYDGYRGRLPVSYRSGKAGLPTFGDAAATFPTATKGVIVPAGDNSSFTLDNASTVYYFEPGLHTTGGHGWFPGTGSVYIGGYSDVTGAAVVDGGGASGTRQQFLQGNGSDVTLEYLTVQNWASSEQSSFINSSSEPGWTIAYNTIGPDLLSYSGGPGQNDAGGYAINMGPDNSIKYNCLTQDAQGGFQAAGGQGDLLVGDVVSHNEISYNGLGVYPDSGNNPNSCGCSGGGKFFWTSNFIFTNNYVHNNYNAGIWGDFNNAGADISHNYIASNWGVAIVYEASYNANISGNTLIGNGWASDGPWPSGGAYECYNNISCTDGDGPVTGGGGDNPYGAIYLPNSGGNSLVRSNYAGELLIEGNTLANNFGGVDIYTDAGRGAGTEPDEGGQCNSPLQGTSSTYYENTAQEDANDAVISTSGSTTTIDSTGGFTLFWSAQCSNPGPVTAPTPGMYVYGPHIPSGDQVAASPSPTANSFALTEPATASSSGAHVDLSTPGGCSLYDLSSSAGPVQVPGTTSGHTAADYWDNCIWGSRNVLVAGNTFTMASDVVAGCTAQNMCGDMQMVAFAPGTDPWWDVWGPYFKDHIAVATSPLNNVWSDNTYTWYGSGGSGSWQFEAGDQGVRLSEATWTSNAYKQDAGSTGLQ
jgi:hypothetical protein